MDFEYKMEITADPEEVFAALTNPFQIELWSGYPADMKAEEGYVFSLWEGDITGVNLEVVPGKLLVQEWFFGEQEKQSIVRITLKKEGARTLVGLTHTHIPEDVYEEITGGWKEYYLEAIKGMLKALYLLCLNFISGEYIFHDEVLSNTFLFNPRASSNDICVGIL